MLLSFIEVPSDVTLNYNHGCLFKLVARYFEVVAKKFSMKKMVFCNWTLEWE